jgi:hypothetical protein
VEDLVSDSDEFLVYCTDQGRHERWQIEPFTVHADHIGWRDQPGFTGPDAAAEAARPGGGVNVGHDSFIFDCERCPRTTQMRAEKWNRLVRELGRVGIDSVDLSRLPF